MRLARALAGHPVMLDFVGPERRPGPSVQTDADIAQHVRQFGTSASHHVGTCRMGVGHMAVVDPRLRVHGIRGLWVVDGSVMPTLISGHPHAVVMMIAEKAGDMIAAEAR